MFKISSLLALFTLFKSVFGQDLSIDWFIPSDVQPLDPITMYARDTLTFVYGGNHNVYIHPSGNCSQDERIFVGASGAGSASYTFKDSEIDTSVTFACDFLNHCNFGQTIKVLVLEPPPSAAPSGAPSVSGAPTMLVTTAPSPVPAVPTSRDIGGTDPPAGSAVAPVQATLFVFFAAGMALFM